MAFNNFILIVFILIVTAQVGRLPDSDSVEGFCSSCRHQPGSRPCLDDVARLVNAWKQLQVCLRDGHSLAWLMDYVMAWRAKLHHELETNSLSQEFKGSGCNG